MNAKQALAQARARWGKRAAVEDMGPKYDITPEQRAAAKIELARLKALPKEQQDRKLIQQTASITWRQRYKVGEIQDMGFMAAFFVRGNGDTWQAAFADADKHFPSKKAA